MATYNQKPGQYAAIQWSGNPADLDAFVAVFDPNKRGVAGNPDNSWTYTVNADGSLAIAGGYRSSNIPAGEWMVSGPYWGTPEPGGLIDYVYGPPVFSLDGLGYTDIEFQARFSAAA